MRRTVLEGVAWAVEELEKIQVVVLQVDQGRDGVGSKGRIASFDDSLQVARRDFISRYVQAEDAEG